MRASSPGSTIMRSVCRVLVACDKFKGTLTAAQANDAVERGIRRCVLDADVQKIALSDGGEGWLASLTGPLGLTRHTVTVTGPAGSQVEAEYGTGRDGLAVVEMALASGLEMVHGPQRNAMNTTSKGFGELIKTAYDRGCRKFLLGIGGSATNDGGLGALQALGVRVEVDNGDGTTSFPDPVYGRHLLSLKSVSLPSPPLDGRGLRATLLPGAEFQIACDVTNPLVGENGATRVFGPQKGVVSLPDGTGDGDRLEEGMRRFASLLVAGGWRDVQTLPGAGAAGGIGGGFAAVLDADLRKGMTILSDALELESHVANADFVITGEGSYDLQTAGGKVVSHVLELGLKHNVPVVVVCGVNKLPPESRSNAFDMVSHYGVEKALGDSAGCLEALVVDEWDSFRLRADISA